MTRWLTVLCALPLISCFDDPGYTTSQFALELAKVGCRWIFTCCDSMEQKDKAGAPTESDCVAQKTTAYLTLYQSADSKVWNAKAARDCVVNVETKGTKCPRALNPSTEANACSIVAATKKPGDFCSNTWDCTTRFCKNGVCANPLASGMACQPAEPCALGLRCANGTCAALKPDNAACTTSDECVSGACGGGKCYVSTTYTCDGQN